jgi:hypothetical protein
MPPVKRARRVVSLVPACALALAALGAAPPRAHAVRPFVTDDARITDVGQLEVESWADFVIEGEEWTTSVNLLFGFTFTEWLQVIAGGGVGVDSEGHFTVTNPVIQPKILLVPARPDGRPGVALAAGVTLPFGTGALFEDATGFFVMAPFTTRLFGDWLFIHANVGVRGSVRSVGGRDELSARPYWGIGFDAGIGDERLRLVGEAYAGDPLEAAGADYAFQAGMRWLESDHLNLDVTFGTEPGRAASDGAPGPWVAWGQVGLRVLFDAFTPGGRPGSPLGASGLLRDPSFEAERAREAERDPDEAEPTR